MKLLLLDRPADGTVIKSREVEFFGPWAQPIDSPEELLKPVFEPYPTSDAVRETGLRAMDSAENILKYLIAIMPDLTGVKRTKRFWRFIFGYHAIILAGIIEDIKTRYSNLPDKDYILGVPDEDYAKNYIPYTWREADTCLVDDDYTRWHAVSLILRPLYDKYEPIKYLRISPMKIGTMTQTIYNTAFLNYHRKFFRKVRSFLLWNFFLRNRKDNNTNYLFWDVYRLEDSDLAKLKAAFLPKSYLSDVKSIPLFDVDREKRKKLKDSLPHPYGELLSMTIPLVSLEGLPNMVNSVDGKKIDGLSRVDRIYTNGQAYLEEASSRILLAEFLDNGKKLISMQHGGGTTYFTHTVDFAERTIADEYICWGNGYLDSDNLPGANRIKVLPSVYLSRLKKENSVMKGKKIWDALFVVLEENRYIKWLYNPLFPDMAYDYFRREKVLFDYFCAEKASAVKVYATTHGWGQADWIRAKYPKARLLTTGLFTDYISKAEIIIVDYNSTGFLEILTIGNPFFATWNRRWFKGKKLFEEFIGRLADVGIFHEQPEGLIKLYKKIGSDNIDAWWNEKKRQDAIKQMADNFAMTSDKVFEEWHKELVR